MLKPILLLADQQTTQQIKISTSKNAGGELRLVANQVALNDLLAALSNTTGVLIHSSALPHGLVTATCSDPNIKAILECLFNKKADMVFRYTQNNPSQQPEEIWVIGNNFAVVQEKKDKREAPVNPVAMIQKPESITTDVSDTDQLMAMAVSQDPEQRIDALALLALDQKIDDATAHSLLTSALLDQNAGVRAQAVDALARREGEAATGILQSALQDSDASVRIMAVDNAGTNKALLQQALHDSDSTVSNYAATKLQALAEQL
ncbi:MAG: HEAT repeat domain-containing protein [Methylovulum sp.]|nr:HEAT repeat domain-containing protein [Methylovulum sp.]